MTKLLDQQLHEIEMHAANPIEDKSRVDSSGGRFHFDSLLLASAASSFRHSARRRAIPIAKPT